ncbi:MAG: hypothetical protein ABIH03_04640 [Pseudomonadota bacterium]
MPSGPDGNRNDHTTSTELVERPDRPTGTGLITQPERFMPPSLLAEQQRAKSEIEAALTIAAARPRDEKECLDRILTSCQRPGVAETAEYEYSRGGTAITGATIRLLELVAQKWGHIDFGFRELARYPGAGGQPGESVVEAFAWDMESNTRRRAQFTVRHEMGLKGGRTKVLTDPRDIYEYIANQAMRRVRTCLENVIPRDIVDAAREECKRTLTTNENITPEKISKVVKAFGEYGVTKAHIEAKLQRHIDSITPAQMVQLRRIYTSLRDGMGEPGDWFDMGAEPGVDAAKSTLDAAKAALRKKATPEPEPKTEPTPPTPAAKPDESTQTAPPDDGNQTADVDYQQRVADYESMIDQANDEEDRKIVTEQVIADTILSGPDKNLLIQKLTPKPGRGRQQKSLV